MFINLWVVSLLPVITWYLPVTDYTPICLQIYGQTLHYHYKSYLYNYKVNKIRSFYTSNNMFVCRGKFQSVWKRMAKSNVSAYYINPNSIGVKYSFIVLSLFYLLIGQNWNFRSLSWLRQFKTGTPNTIRVNYISK